ncbi:CCAAT enhancer-binding beta-like, partial [Olea europaea subsp. europaea]
MDIGKNYSYYTIDSTTMSSYQGSNGTSKKLIDKGSDEYKKRRERNNVAVRKSREKAKMRSRDTERRVAELSKENQLYRAQYEELRREFNVLKSLLLKTGLTEQ